MGVLAGHVLATHPELGQRVPTGKGVQLPQTPIWLRRRCLAKACWPSSLAIALS
jgi:hypothetical protein